MAEDNKLFDAPIPGQSLTAEVGARPWQQPAQHSTVEDAFEFYVKKITDPEVNDSLLDTLEMGTPVTSISEVLGQRRGMEGKHTIDVSIQLLPVIMELIAYVAETSGINYNMGIEKTIDQDIIPESKIELAAKRIKDRMPKDVEEEMPMVEPETMIEESPQEGGIMSRRI